MAEVPSRAASRRTSTTTEDANAGGRKSTKRANTADEKSKNWWVRSRASTKWNPNPSSTP